MEKPRSTLVIDDFAMVSNRGRFPKHPGEASLLNNMNTPRAGELAVRKSFSAVVSGAGAVKTMFYYDLASPVLLCVVGGTVTSHSLS